MRILPILFSIVLIVIFCLPVVLLPSITAVPYWICMILAAVMLFFINLQIRSGKAKKRRIITWIGLLLTSILAIALSQFFASTPPIVDSNGQQIPDTIASLEKVTINESDRWISIRGQNRENPVLLFLSGGSGGSQLVTERRALGKLEESFVVVNWFRGLLDTMDKVYPQLWEVDFRFQAPVLEIPVYFLIGRHDVNAPPALTEAYYQILQVPKKELIWFERSGHNPWITEADLFSEVFVDRFLFDSSQ